MASLKELLKSKKLRLFFSFRSNSVFYRLTMAFGLFFLGPLLGFIFISIQTDLFGTNELFYSLIGLLISTLFGYIIMRQISDGIARLEARMADKLDAYGRQADFGEDELENISLFADIMDKSIRKTGESLNRRVNEIHALQELGGLSTFQFTARSLALTALERSVAVTEADGGAILFLNGKRGICSMKVGGGVKLKKKQSFSLQSFPWLSSVKRQTPLFLKGEEVSCRTEYFFEDCGFAAVIPFGRIGSTQAVALVAGKKDSGWDNTTVEFLNTYFRGIGNIMKMQEIDIQKRETAHELKIVLSLIKILHSNPGKNELLNIIAQKMEKIVPYHWIGLALEGDDGKGLYLSHSFSKFTPEIQTGLSLPNETSLFHLAMNSREILSVSDLMSEREYFEKGLFTKLGLRSCIFASLNSGGRRTGAICLASEKKAAFGRKEKRIFAMVAMGVAIAIEQSRLFARERAKRAELEVLNTIAGELTQHTIQVNTILPAVLKRIAEFVKVEAGSIMLLEHDALVIEAALGKFGKVLEQKRLSLEWGVAGYVVATGESVIVADVKKNKYFRSFIDEQTGFETRSLLCVPLISGGRIIGAIELVNSIDKPFTEDDREAVQAVAASTAMALENTRLYSESTDVAKREKLIRTVFQKYVPEEVVAKILESGEVDHMAVSEKKTVTVFNVDIRGYTRMSSMASAEDVVKILNQFFKKMGNIILQHRGLVDKYLGDGMLAIFGAPVLTANPALDAVRAAQEMIRIIDELSLLSMDRCGVPLKIGVSINTGEAIVGNIGFSKKMEYTVIGEVVNETFRLQDLTRKKANSILISEATYNLVKSEVTARPHGLQKLDDTTFVNVFEVFADNQPEEAAQTGAAWQENAATIH